MPNTHSWTATKLLAQRFYSSAVHDYLCEFHEAQDTECAKCDMPYRYHSVLNNEHHRLAFDGSVLIWELDAAQSGCARVLIPGNMNHPSYDLARLQYWDIDRWRTDPDTAIDYGIQDTIYEYGLLLREEEVI